MMKQIIASAAFTLCSSFAAAQLTLPCTGDKQPLEIVSNMPYIKTYIGNAAGMFLVDFGTNVSSVDTANFLSGARPASVPGSPGSFADFDFFGSWGTVGLLRAQYSHLNLPIKQAGIIGTDFLMNNVFILDYANKSILRFNNSNKCSDQQLTAAGFSAVSTKGYYSNSFNNLLPNTPNIPTIPVKFGNTAAVAQIDPGFDDTLYRFSININKALFDAMKADGIMLKEFPQADLTLTSCNGSSETVKSYKLPAGVAFKLVDVNNQVIRSFPDVILFLKDPPASASACGGIGTWSKPAAQFGASFLNLSQQVVFDPFSSLVWFRLRNSSSQMQMQQRQQMQIPGQGNGQQPQVPQQIPQQIQQRTH